MASRVAEARYLDADESADEHDHLNEFILLEVVGRGAIGTVRRGIAIVQGEQREYCLKFMSRRALRRTREPVGVALRRRDDNDDDGDGDDRDEVVLYMTGLERLQREIKIMELLQAAGTASTLRLLQVIDDPDDDSIVLVTEFMSMGSVLKLKEGNSDGGGGGEYSVPSEEREERRFSPHRVKALMGDFLRALEFVHSQGVCHRDLKPENLLLDAQGVLKIGDWGCAECFDRSDNPMALVTHTAGTPAFWPPESIRLAPLNLGLDLDQDQELDLEVPLLAGAEQTTFSCYSADCWAAGLVLYCLLELRLPFRSEDASEMFRLIVEAPLPLPRVLQGGGGGCDGESNAAAVALLQGLCCKDPAERLDVSGALAASYFTHV